MDDERNDTLPPKPADAGPVPQSPGNDPRNDANRFWWNQHLAVQGHALDEYVRLIHAMGLSPLSPDEPWREVEPEVFAKVRRCYPTLTKAEWTGMSYVERVPFLRQATAATDAPLATHKAKKGKAAEKRSWTQPELNTAIETEIAKYSEAIASAHNGSKVARRDIRKVLTRNAIAKRLGVKAAKMVGNSSVWQRLADEFGMRKTGKATVSRPTKIGLPIAEEVAGDAAGDTTAADVLRRETLTLLDDAIANVRNPDKQQEGKIRKALTDTKDKLTRGEIDDDKAREIAQFTQSQQQDDRSRKVLNTR